MKIGLFYGSTTCYTEMAAEKIQAEIGADLVDTINIKDAPLADCQAYDIVIFGISTWDFGELQEDWESTWDDIASLKLDDKIVALFGLGDQEGYGQWFQDALGMLHDEVIAHQATIVGYWPNQGYEFEASKALTEDGEFFVGLSLDDENQYDLTEQRIKDWCEQILSEINDILNNAG
ncbi:flavodoxin FldB [Thalassotalea maritima]|uniref:flavodoxin FldB n=1 Tax=Thalassotalea maritima TaxID=3242416 RepID=UPI0035271EB0